MIQYRCEVMPLFTIGAGAFRPPPRVESAFVRLRPYHTPPVAVQDEAVLAAVVQQAFSQRRKTLRNVLRDLVDAGTMQALGIDPALRAEMLGIREFAALANHVATGRES
jgi:16S rRNA (adenine1518-N6/adenine1519-N6)-dimethyltransferase